MGIETDIHVPIWDRFASIPEPTGAGRRFLKAMDDAIRANVNGFIDQLTGFDLAILIAVDCVIASIEADRPVSDSDLLSGLRLKKLALAKVDSHNSVELGDAVRLYCTAVADYHTEIADSYGHDASGENARRRRLHVAAATNYRMINDKLAPQDEALELDFIRAARADSNPELPWNEALRQYTDGKIEYFTEA